MVAYTQDLTDQFTAEQFETEDEARARRWADAIFDHIFKEGVLGKEQIRTALLREMLVDKEASQRTHTPEEVTKAVNKLQALVLKEHLATPSMEEIMEQIPGDTLRIKKTDPRKTLQDKAEDWVSARLVKGRLIPAKILGAIAFRGFKEGYPGMFESMNVQFDYSTSVDAWTAVGAQMNVATWDQPFEELLGELHASYVDAKRGAAGPRHEPNNKSWTDSFHRAWESAAKAMVLAMYAVNYLDEDRGTQHAKAEPFGQPDMGDVKPLGQPRPDFKGLPY